MASIDRVYSQDRLGWAHTDIFKAGLDPFAFTVYMNLAARADSHGKAWPKQETIAADCRISERQVRRCLDELIAAKLLVVLEQSGTRGGRRSVYYLATRNEWISQQLAKASQPDCETALQPANRTDGPPQPDCQSGSHVKEVDPKEVDPTKGETPLASSPMSAEAVFAGALQSQRNRKAPKPPKAKKEAAPDPKTFLKLDVTPAEFRQSDDFVEAWDGWGQMRIEMKKPLTERAAKLAIQELAKYGLQIAIDALKASIINNWQGVFPKSIASPGGKGRFAGSSSEQPKQDFGDW